MRIPMTVSKTVSKQNTLMTRNVGTTPDYTMHQFLEESQAIFVICYALFSKVPSFFVFLCLISIIETIKQRIKQYNIMN